ncbi:MAG: hypothetical protein L0K95_14655 [Tetragenococcus koreensis]|nr:hypothetical protein [Alkalibacterium sp.]MDN6580983.1 hypothetical protein [Tetragenococcus koreensis]
MINITKTSKTPDDFVKVTYDGISYEKSSAEGSIYIPKDEFEEMSVKDMKKRVKNKIIQELLQEEEDSL